MYICRIGCKVTNKQAKCKIIKFFLAKYLVSL